ncbi:UNKNOWN [Stylonychia lemnae]|uniref:Uncharacterized protein n=1 Tax=Stylonychia lemnae TaxID=5949 RepID=A0A078AV67_STYLE|nr:UNKNOWN [Stylonychia lemnae]|eukprot:CDW85162.1 UNKNOWN [Stylonychia lemnae]
MADIKSAHSTSSKGQYMNQIEESRPNSELVERTRQMSLNRRKHFETSAIDQENVTAEGKRSKKAIEAIELKGIVSSQEEVLQRKFFRAKRSDSTTPMCQNGSQIQTSVNTHSKIINGEDSSNPDHPPQGQFKIAGSLTQLQNSSQSSSNSLPSIAPIKFNFTNPFTNQRTPSQMSNQATVGSDNIHSQGLISTQSSNSQTNASANQHNQNQFKFQVSFNNQGTGSTDNQTSNLDNYKVGSSLRGEQKFVVNKDLFSNPHIRNPFNKYNETKDSNSESVKSSRSIDENQLVQQNPLNSTVSLSFQKKLSTNVEDSPQIKSLFEFQENERFRPGPDFKPKSTFNFSEENLFGKKPDVSEGGNERGIVVKPNFANMTNPFKIPGSTSSLFTSGQSLFNTSNLTQSNGNNNNSGWKPQPSWLKQKTASSNSSAGKQAENQEGEEDEKLEPDVKEKIQTNSQFEKIFQRQILKLKSQKGIGQPDKKPAKKDTGFLSIEKFRSPQSSASNENKAENNTPVIQPDQMHFLVFRDFLGNPKFNSVINRKVAKIKEISDKQYQFKVKVAVLVKDLDSKQYETEFVELKFINESDKSVFMKVFKQIALLNDSPKGTLVAKAQQE